MRLFDSHAHLDIRDFGSCPSISAEQMISEAEASGLVGILAIAGATSPGKFEETLVIAEKHSWIWAAAGIHPHTASAATPEILGKLKQVLKHPRIVALGEIGLDYHYNFSLPAEQRQIFAKQLEIAHEINLPVIVHTREAEQDTLEILKVNRADEFGGVIHCFTASAGFAEKALDLGFYISFSGIITFPKAGEIREVARTIPENRILAETDSPFLSPKPFRGRPNTPSRVVHVVEKLAEIRGTNIEVMAEITTTNTHNCFNISF